MKQLTVFSVGFSLAILTIVAVSAGLAYSQSPEPKRNKLSANEPLLKDARMYATEFNVSTKEAVHRMKVQDGPVGDRISDLEAQLTKNERDVFAGLYIQHKPKYRVIVLVTRGAGKVVRPYIKNLSLSSLVEVRPAKATLAELKANQAKAVRTVRKLDLPAESFVDIINNQVKVRVTNRERLYAGMRTLKERQNTGIVSGLPKRVKVVEVPELLKLSSDILGGLKIYPRS